MPASGLDATFFVEKPPLIEYRDGLFHVQYDIGTNHRFEVVLTRNVYYAAFAKAARVARESNVCGAEIIQFRVGPLIEDDDEALEA